MIAQQVGGKATRDALFLSNYPASELPKVMLAAAVLAVVAVLAMSRGLSRFGPARLVPVVFALSGGVFAGEWLLMPQRPGLTSTIVYLHVAVVGFTVISGFWSVINERFDPHTAKKVVSRIAAGATIGGLVGGVTAERVAAHLNAHAMLLVLAALNLMCAVGAWRTGATLGKAQPRSQPGQQASTSGFGHLRANRYLQLIGLLVALCAVAAGLVDYVFKARAASVFDTGESLMSFFAIFYTATSLVAVVLQTGLGGRTLSRLGIGGTIAVLPAALLLVGVLGAAVTRLWTMVVLRGAQTVLNNSLFRGAYELLFTPVAPEVKRPTKTLLDVGCERLGGAIASAIMLGLVALWPAGADTVAILLTVAVAAVTLLVSLRLHRGYVAELAASLRSGAIELDEKDIVDATTRRTLSETTMAIDRENLLEQIQKLRSEQQAKAADSSGPSDAEPVGLTTLESAQRSGRPGPGEGETAPLDAADATPADRAPQVARQDALIDRMAALRSGDRERIRQILRGRIEPELVALAIPLLGRDDVARPARRALRSIVTRIVGQLTDALLDSSLPLKARRRVASLLGSCADRRAACGLLAALLDEEDAEIRRRCARSLGEIVRHDPQLAPSAAVVDQAVEQELGRETKAELDHVFAILSLAYDAEVLKLALRALRSNDESLQGTSLEYLENVLPEAITDSLWPHLEELCQSSTPSAGPPSARAPQPRRPDKEIAEELRRSVAGLVIDREALREPTRE